MKAKPATGSLLLLSITFAAVVVGFVVFPGCAGGAYIPPVSNKAVSGKQITASDASFIVPGKTTRAEVTRTLGTKYLRESPRIAAMGYGWELPGGYTVIWMLDSSASQELTRWRALFLAFDDKGVVTRKEFVSLRARRSLDEQLEKWAGLTVP